MKNQTAIRNLPENVPIKITSLVNTKPHQVVSMSLSSGEHVSITVLAFDEGESVSDETYSGDTMYQIVEGTVFIICGEEKIRAETGEVIKIPAEETHRLESDGAFKIIQITLRS